MKTILSLILITVLALPGVSLAFQHSEQAFALMSSASAGVKTTAAYDVRKFKTKSIQVSGATLTSNNSAVTFKNMSGTVIAECSQNASLWDTCIANDYAQTAVSRTTNGIFSWTDAFNYVRLKWTGGTVGGKLKAFLSMTE